MALSPKIIISYYLKNLLAPLAQIKCNTLNEVDAVNTVNSITLKTRTVLLKQNLLYLFWLCIILKQLAAIKVKFMFLLLMKLLSVIDRCALCIICNDRYLRDSNMLIFVLGSRQLSDSSSAFQITSPSMRTTKKKQGWSRPTGVKCTRFLLSLEAYI